MKPELNGFQFGGCIMDSPEERCKGCGEGISDEMAKLQVLELAWATIFFVAR